MLKIKSSVIPADWKGFARETNKPVSDGKRTVCPNDMSFTEWVASAEKSLRVWFLQKNIGMNHISSSDLHRIDNMNKHLFNR